MRDDFYLDVDLPPRLKESMQLHPDDDLQWWPLDLQNSFARWYEYDLDRVKPKFNKTGMAPGKRLFSEYQVLYNVSLVLRFHSPEHGIPKLSVFHQQYILNCMREFPDSPVLQDAFKRHETAVAAGEESLRSVERPKSMRTADFIDLFYEVCADIPSSASNVGIAEAMVNRGYGIKHRNASSRSAAKRISALKLVHPKKVPNQKLHS